ncbi:hypothetical protein A2876_04620 [Candidatus Amesbacteria bacterium RIFCSPHIGHO2_01_FULL_48_32b]|uniref:Uncharacterized protein n=1 Tax=Candidatus Amesbacteria bacterium RIFCSPHIGHO2_01_FULL_48_32b TaxID=1797253 RepID=A0A1F4YDI1_9BACT|nr:MAG: hypothetical protein A2876_04620 [Candidatus Amesbacteria bacterium RIFCSPHIGHO2_01_FULL_48_32b]
MNKIAGMRFKYKFLNNEESSRRMEMAYGKIFQLALERIRLELLSTLEYTNGNGGKGGISNTRGSCRPTQSQKDYHLPNVPSRQDPGSEVWEGMADKQSVIYGVVSRKGD